LAQIAAENGDREGVESDSGRDLGAMAPAAVLYQRHVPLRSVCLVARVLPVHDCRLSNGRLYTWIFNNTRRSTLAAILSHFVSNFTYELANVTAQTNLYSNLWIIAAIAVVAL
jgi:hypothetical protein